MKNLGLDYCALLCCTTAAFFAGCAGAQPATGTPIAVANVRTLTEANRAELLYATTTGHQYVYAINYPEMSLRARLGPFPGLGPQICTNGANGDLYG